MSAETGRPAGYEYIVVGSGAGGGPVAANLAEAGRRVLLLEAGGDPMQLAGGRLPEDYSVPAFHAFASENGAIAWNFFVRHYAADARQRRDEKKYVEFLDDKRVGGILYPRAGTLGGCTAHNAMILVYPHNADWDHIAELTGDSSWKAENMRRYFAGMEDCRHRPVHRWLKNSLGLNFTRHGFGGWLTTERPFCMQALRDDALMEVIRASARKAIRNEQHLLKRVLWMIQSQADPNDWRLVKSDSFGIRYAPLTTRDGVRVGSRERLLDVAARHPDKLKIELDALATRVLFDNDNRAVGVEYLKGERLYRAHANPSSAGGERRQAFASRETILCGGAFNTPQLLMLSGIGPRQELERHGIEVRVDLPGVGANLQDRYEVSVVNRMKENWKSLAGAKFEKGDQHYREWEAKKGIYTANGAALVVIKKSQVAQLPDLFCLGLLARFEGYFPGYSECVKRHQNYLSWVVLKAHTLNTAGTVKLRSADPRDPPLIDFHYFDEGDDVAQRDLKSVVEGIRFVRKMTAAITEHIEEEELPGKAVQSETELQQFVKDNAWGHHASCTCPIGPRASRGVLTSDFRVHGTQGLRVVDASVFPRIPGFFIVSAVYMIGEKASDAILADAR